jgi:hypothetical protein
MSVQRDTSEGEETKIFKTSKDLIQFYSDKSEFCWNKYLTLVHLLISLSGATVLVFFNSINIMNLKGYINIPSAVFAIIAASLALLFAFVWRCTVQYFMEREVFGSIKEKERYFKEIGLVQMISPQNDERFVHNYRKLYLVVQTLTILLLLTSWGSLLFFISSNLPTHKCII